MADGETVTMQPDCPKGLSVEVQASPDTSNDDNEVLHNDPRQSEPYQQLSGTVEVAALTDIAPIDHNSTISEEIRELREQVQRLQMKAGVDSLNAKESASQISSGELEKLRRIKNCLRKHWQEWDDRDDVEASLSGISLEPIIERLRDSSRNKHTAGAFLMLGRRNRANRYLNDLGSDDEDAYDDNNMDDEDRSQREKLILKRREHLRAIQLGIESITEDLIGMRLNRRLQKQQREARLQEQRMAAELEREAELKTAEQDQHANDETTTTEGNKPETILPAVPETIIYAVPKANLVNWNSFKGLGQAKENTSYVIDVLVGEPVIEKENVRYNWNRRDRLAKKSQAQKQSVATLSTGSRGQGPLPERIRIHSSLFLQIFAKLIDPDGVQLDLSEPSLVFLRPFKAITHYEYRLRNWLTRREEDIETQDRMLDLAGKTSYDDIILESPTARAHLRCVLECFDAHIKARIEFLQSSDCRKVFFSDLWHIYRPGTEVIGLDGKQAYRVIQVASSRHRPISNRLFYYNYAYKGKDDDKSEPSEFTLHCSYIDFDGKYIGPVLRTFEVKRFDGERDITSLEVYPLRFHKLKQDDFNFTTRKELEEIPEQDRCRANLIQRGAKFVQVAAVKHMYYSGPTMVVREEVESQVVVDFATCFAAEGELQKHIQRPSLEGFIGEAVEGQDDQESSAGRCECCLYETVYEDDKFVDKNLRNDYINSILSKKDREEPPSVAICPRPFDEMKTSSGDGPTFSDEELVIMSYRVFGFVLRNRKWAQLDLTYLTEVRETTTVDPVTGQRVEDGNTGKEKETAFDQLVLESGHKDMIISLITQHFKDKQAKAAQMEQVDIVRGKGKGLILLLHGAPGVGKTSTAEGVAERFQKPLFQITCGDLGVTARDVEKTLQTNFNLATKWGCILLLDEADVFLAQRDKTDFIRNGMVAAFLRVLEYYAGILFLTTNRIGDFDEAFTSRIHISLYYPELDEKKTVDIFKLNLDLIQSRFKRMDRDVQIDYKRIKRFAKMHYLYYSDSRWNGRQIRNACQTALALAEYQAQEDKKPAGLDSEAADKITVELTVEHFETVRNAYLEFTNYLAELYGATTAKVAGERYLRVEENSNRGDPIYSTQELYEMFKEERKRGSYRPPSPQQKPSYEAQSSAEANKRFREKQSRRSQNDRSMRDRNQTEPSSTSKDHRVQRLLRPEMVEPSPRPSPKSYQQRNAPPSDIGRESSSRGNGNHQRRKEKREPQPSRDHEGVAEDDNDDDSSDTWQQRRDQREQGSDEMSEEGQEDVDTSDSEFEEETGRKGTRGQREQADSRFTGRQK
ncbi:uncharacterized protein Triagg1_1364 [Trichoderma aggressivum f. europaeum]|uniref:AAA+ ATPase domain-containing protein n=1 Tax=Trichoderma aggressivum f. europaeum TaxID=173218 RepID=A0AAE1IJJ6_9HYPO|nr:hypothetical protein Triagg1_1364 [Trichoderma aggressivum f. europaeum]